MWSAIACLSMPDHGRGAIGGPMKAHAIFSVGVGQALLVPLELLLRVVLK